ncbi:hypothetical protein PROFUN_14989 [Planoprotostelium fungivorum]|uniref:Uncharacterized protein n=1 Tax=Planoprotostelium fungivorum TaxID=1890364 RepID=A0A2P6MY31_9EUKA|nr:hypothetical protein PROFUN_14989 [Planoprotostelium fungivorum]
MAQLFVPRMVSLLSVSAEHRQAGIQGELPESPMRVFIVLTDTHKQVQEAVKEVPKHLGSVNRNCEKQLHVPKAITDPDLYLR